ncbi:MAG: hypothetical protein V1804_00800 [Patescibacteria group bacterium]
MQLNIKTDKYQWTNHSLMKMRYYGLSQQRIKRVIKNPERIEEGIVEKTIACMQTSESSKHPYEIWAMYQISKLKVKSQKSKNTTEKSKFKNILDTKYQIQNTKIKIISAWRYPGKSPKNNPIPQEILDEIKSLL